MPEQMISRKSDIALNRSAVFEDTRTSEVMPRSLLSAGEVTGVQYSPPRCPGPADSPGFPASDAAPSTGDRSKSPPEERPMSASGSDRAIAAVMQWAAREEWRGWLEDVIADHLAPACLAAG